jgi:hypothetical protein
VQDGDADGEEASKGVAEKMTEKGRGVRRVARGGSGSTGGRREGVEEESVHAGAESG